MAINGVAEFQARLIAKDFYKEYNRIKKDILGAPELDLRIKSAGDINRLAEDFGGLVEKASLASLGLQNASQAIGGLASRFDGARDRALAATAAFTAAYAAASTYQTTQQDLPVH
jgi:hypothetical protein